MGRDPGWRATGRKRVSCPSSLLSLWGLVHTSPDVSLPGAELAAVLQEVRSQTGGSDNHTDNCRALTGATVGEDGALWEHRAGPPTQAKQGRMMSQGKRHFCWSLGDECSNQEWSRWWRRWQGAGQREQM